MTDWLDMTLGDFITLQRGYDLPESERRSGNVPVVGSFGITGYHDTPKAKGPGVTVGRSGASFGTVFYCPVDFWPHNAALYVTDFHGNDEKFAYYFLKTFDFTAYNSGSAQPSLNRNYIYPISITVPPLDEQRAIAEVLGSLDDKIEANRRQNETLEATARAIFKSWFVDFDPVHAKARGEHPPGMDAATAALFPDSFEESELGLIPSGWGWEQLKNVTEFIMSGGTPSTKVDDYWNGDIPWLSSGETRKRFITETEKTITELGVQDSSTRLAPEWATVIASAGQGHTRGQTSLLMLETYINQSVVALGAAYPPVSALYLFFSLSSRYDELRRISDSYSDSAERTQYDPKNVGHRGSKWCDNGSNFRQNDLFSVESYSSRGSLTTRILKDLELAIPSFELIEVLDYVTTPIVNQIAHNERESRTLAETRDALLPRLVSGELRVGEV